MIDKKARDYLLGIPLWTKKKNTLDEVRHFLKELGNPDEQLNIIHVAGTNGKGSVCADLTAMLMEAGYHVGTFVSPHLTDVTERFLVDGVPVEEAGFSESFARVKAVTDRLTAEGYAHPTFFEFVFLMAMDLYGRRKPDFVVLETGLGGRLDTTNVIRHPLACVITSISLDHTQYLGDTVELIAAEKAGIIKPGIPVVYDNNDRAAGAVIAAAADMHPQIQLLFAAVSDKDYHEMIRLLCTELSPERVTVVQLKSERGLQADALARQFEDAGCSHVTAFDSTKDALKHVLSEKKEGDHLYMVGSLYLIGEILEDLKLQLHRM